MDKRYVMLWNGGLYHAGNKNIFTLAELSREFREEMCFKSDLVCHGSNEDDYNAPNKDTLEDLFKHLIDAGEWGSTHYIFEETVAERGCDYVEASLVSVNE